MDSAIAKGEWCGTDKGERAESNPMAMGIGMAKKITGQMGQVGSPMEICKR
jgi:hypothetical protein